MIFTSWIGLILFIKLSVIIGRKLGPTTLPQEEIPFYPFRFMTDIRWYPHKFWIALQSSAPRMFWYTEVRLLHSKWILLGLCTSGMGHHVSYLDVFGNVENCLLFSTSFSLHPESYWCRRQEIWLQHSEIDPGNVLLPYQVEENTKDTKLSTKQLKYFSTRTPKKSNFLLPRGFSFNLALLAWAIASGFLLEFFDSLLLTGQMDPKYSNFVKTRKDMIDSNMTLGWILK